MKNFNFRIIAATILAFSMVFASCKSKKANKADIIDEQKIEEIMEMTIAQRNNNFALDFLRAIGSYDENIVVSPFSISSALAMTYAGAGGDTEKQMAQTFYFAPNQEGFHLEYGKYLEMLRSLAGSKIELNIANNLWGQQGFHFRKEFFQLLDKYYQARLVEVDFQGGDLEAIRQDINSWVEKMTKENIRNLIPPRALVPDTRLVLVNAIHFYGPWQVAFDEKKTQQRTFFNIDNTRAVTNFMYRNDELNYMENETLQALEIPYSDGTYSMVIMLPKEGIDMLGFEKQLSEKVYSDIISSLSKAKVEVFLPKFKVEYKSNLETLLGQMGMPLAFSNDADFTKMSEHDDLKIDQIIHQAMIDVSEAGTEAAAATAVVIVRKTSMVDEQKIVFDANRPYLYFIKENNENSIVFMGRQVKF
jgi:serpin B